MSNVNYAVARVVQHTRASVGKFERHIERKNDSYENMNVVLSRTPLNVRFKGCGVTPDDKRRFAPDPRSLGRRLRVAGNADCGAALSVV